MITNEQTSENNGVEDRFISYAQNFEDVMLWRALKHIKNGFYIDVGAQDPIIDSVSKAFYEHGWRGVHVEATPHYAELLRKDRPDEIVIEVALSDKQGTIVFYEIPETGLSTGDTAIALNHKNKGYPINEITVSCITLAKVFDDVGTRDIHWLKIDAEGMEKQILSAWGKTSTRPWIVIVESTLPNSQIETNKEWEDFIITRGYNSVYFDGLNSYYISEQHLELSNAFRCGPNVFDNFVLNGTANAPFCFLIIEQLIKQKNHIMKDSQELGGQFKIDLPNLPNKFEENCSLNGFENSHKGIISYAQNFEDVILWRALGHIKNGFYIDIGAQDPIIDSVSKAFYDNGWRGHHVEPTPYYANLLRCNRPDETVSELAINNIAEEIILYEIPNTGLSTGNRDIAQRHRKQGYYVKDIRVQSITLATLFDKAGKNDIHWLKIDVEGMELETLTGWGESKIRPWIIVVESTFPTTQIETHEQWEHLLILRGYRMVYFDGLSRFYISEFHTELDNAFRAGPNIFDGFVLSGYGGSYFSLKLIQNLINKNQIKESTIAI